MPFWRVMVFATLNGILWGVIMGGDKGMAVSIITTLMWLITFDREKP